MMAIAWRSKWLDWKPGDEIISVFPQTELTKPTKPTSVSFVSAASGETQIISAPADDRDAWREAFHQWRTWQCVSKDRCFGGIGSLHVHFCEWTVKSSTVAPCTRTTFERLLSDAEFLLADGFVSGLILVEDWQEARA